MALSWNVQDIRNWKSVCWEDSDKDDGTTRLKTVTETLIFATIFLGFGCISRENHKEFFTRMHMWERAFGSLRQLLAEDAAGNRDVFYTLHEIEQHIGLTTNASTMTRATFDRHLVRRLRTEATSELLSWIKAEEASDAQAQV